MTILSFIYFTDFHGHQSKYERLLRDAVKIGVKLLVSGGDLCPHHAPNNFLHKFFPKWLKRAQKGGIKVYGMFGNDDLAAHLPILDDWERQGLFVRIDGKMVEYEGWKFWGYNFVPELPFGLKDWVKLDYEGAPRPPQLSHPLITIENSYIIIPDIELFFHNRNTIEEDLQPVRFTDPAHTVVVTHSPPYGVGLDVTADGGKVGSRSILKFIQREQPILSLHGHIHESPQVSGKWQVEIGNTLAIQPGPFPVLITLTENEVQAQYI